MCGGFVRRCFFCWTTMCGFCTPTTRVLLDDGKDAAGVDYIYVIGCEMSEEKRRVFPSWFHLALPFQKVNMDMKFKSVLVPLLLSLLLSPYADSASNDGLLRIGLKRKTLDLNNLEAARLKGRQSLKGALLKYGLNGYLVGSEEGDAVKLTNTWMLSILGRLVLVPHHRSSLLSLIQAVQTCGCHRPSATSRLLAIFIPSTNLAYLALTRKTENQLIFIMELEPFLDTLAKTMSMLAI